MYRYLEMESKYEVKKGSYSREGNPYDNACIESLKIIPNMRKKCRPRT